MSATYPPVTLSPSAIDAFVAEADRLAGESHALRNEYLMSHSLPYAQPEEADPFSPTYRDWVLNQWRIAAGRSDYRLELEHDDNVQVTVEQLGRLYPFVSGDTRFISQYMMGAFHALGLLTDLPNRRVVEYGIGWGNTSLALLQAGFELLAVDIDPKWLALLELRARQSGVAERLQTLHGEFGSFPADCPPMGAALFYECFHHALNHDEALDRISSQLADGGAVVFAGETIYRNFPIEWGVRHDGHSLWAIRRFGWMELGFSEDYFIRLTRRHRLALSRHDLESIGPFGIVYKGVLHAGGMPMGRTLLTSTETGFLPPEADPTIGTRFTDGDALLELPCGHARSSLELRNWLPRDLACSISIDDRATWAGTVAAGSTQWVDLPGRETGYVQRVRILSGSHVPAELGTSSDTRRLGIAVGQLLQHDD